MDDEEVSIDPDQCQRMLLDVHRSVIVGKDRVAFCKGKPIKEKEAAKSRRVSFQGELTLAKTYSEMAVQGNSEETIILHSLGCLCYSKVDRNCE
jgi:hypothetical protein